MPRAKSNKLYRTFVKGLITEAGYLTYPENASSDELNTILSRKGNRTRRLGIDYEDDYVLNNLGISETSVFNEYVWKAVANVTNTNFLCIQIGPVVSFFSLEGDPVSDSLKEFNVDLRDYKAPTAQDDQIGQETASFAHGKGYLFIVHPRTEPVVVEYDPAADTISIVPIIIQVRDFEGVYDGLPNDFEPTTLSTEHHYNLMNQGWVVPGTRQGASNGQTGSAPDVLTYIDPYTGQSVPFNYRSGINFGNIGLP